MSSFTGSVLKGYGRFFDGCANFAISPYTGTYNLVAGKEPKDDDKAAAFLAVILLTVIPVLPALCQITFPMAGLAMMIALGTMLFTFPAALIMDIFDPRNCMPSYS